MSFFRQAQGYNMFQDLWNRFPYLGSWGWVQMPIGAKDVQTVRYADKQDWCWVGAMSLRQTNRYDWWWVGAKSL